MVYTFPPQQNPEVKNAEGNTPMHWACLNGHAEVRQSGWQSEAGCVHLFLLQPLGTGVYCNRAAAAALTDQARRLHLPQTAVGVVPRGATPARAVAMGACCAGGEGTLEQGRQCSCPQQVSSLCITADTATRFDTADGCPCAALQHPATSSCCTGVSMCDNTHPLAAVLQCWPYAC